MAKFVWVFAFLCIQFSRGEDILEIDNLNDVTDGVIPLPDKISSEVIGESDQKKTEPSEEEWTEEDQKWLDEIQSLLAGDSDEDYDTDFVEIGKLFSDIEELMKEHHPENSNYQWLEEIVKWVTDDDYDDNDSESNESDEFYSWLYGKKDKKAERPLKKRFSSV